MTIQCQTCLTNPAIQMNLLQQQQQMQLMQQSDMQNALLMQQQQHIQNAEFMQHQESQNQVLMQYREPFVEQPQIQPPVVPVKSDIPANTDQQVVKQPEVVQPVEPQKPNNDNSKSVVNPMVSNEAQQVPTADIVQDAKPADPNKLNRDKSGSSFLPRLNDKDSKPNRESNDMILANKSKERLTNLGGNAIDTTPNPSSVPAKNPALQPILGHKVLLTPLGSKAGVNKLPGLNVGNRSSPSLPDPNDPSVAVASKLLSLGNIKRNPDI